MRKSVALFADDHYQRVVGVAMFLKRGQQLPNLIVIVGDLGEVL